ncbi:MAG: serine/threonine-protein kinase PknK [Planctomycetota bacterium]
MSADGVAGETLARRALLMFEALVALAPEARAAWLAAACSGDTDLQRAVERMIQADTTPSFLDPPSDTQSDLPRELGPYRLLRTLGAGGMGTVHLAETIRPVRTLPAGSQVAIKVLHPHLLEAEGFFKRFLREAEAGMRIEHENVVRTLDCDAIVQGGRPHHFLVMEYVEGRTLLDLVRELGRVPEELCRHVGLKVAAGLVCIHEAGILHRDLKPENLLITGDHVVKIMDLGIARLHDEAARLSVAGQFVGTLAYAAPEHVQGDDADIDGRADLYALGATLYHLLSGRVPHEARSPGELVRRVLDHEPPPLDRIDPPPSPFLRTLVHTLLAKRPGERLDSAADLHEVLARGEASTWWTDRQRELQERTARAPRRLPVDRTAAVFGRDPQLAALRAHFEDVKQGAGRVVLVEGEAGVGKSRLVDELVARLHADGEEVTFLFGTYPQGGAVSAWAGFAAAFREHLGGVDLPARVGGHLGSAQALASAFAALLLDEGVPVGTEQQLTEEVLQTLFVRLTRSLAAGTPTILLIDDLEAAPEAGRGLFSALARALVSSRVLLVGTLGDGACDGWASELARADHVERMPLGRLGPKDLFALLQDTFRSEALARDLGMAIALKSDGNPYFALEIIRGLEEAGHVDLGPDGRWRARHTIDRIEMPSSILGLIEGRLADVDHEDRVLLDQAACLGASFDPALLAAVRGEHRIQVLQACARIERSHRLLRAEGRGYAFDHPQIRDVLDAHLHEQLREAYHAGIAEALAARAPLDAAGVVALCEHAAAGAVPELGRTHLGLALERLESTYEPTRAAQLARAYLEANGLLEGAERAEILLRQAAALAPAGDAASQEAVLREAVARAADAAPPALHGKALLALGRFLHQTARYDEARETYDQARTLAKGSGLLGVHVDATLGASTVLQAHGSYAEAETLADACLTLSEELGDARRELPARLQLASLLIQRGETDAAEAHAQRGLELALDQDDLLRASTARTLLGNLALHAGRFEDAIAQHEQVLDAARRMGSRRSELTCRTNLANALVARGEIRAALDIRGPQLQLARELGMPRSEAIVWVNLASLLLTLGDLEQALEAAERCIEITRELGLRRIESYGLHQRAGVLRFLGRYDEADTGYAEALAVRDELGYRRGVVSTLMARGEMRAELGHRHEAREDLARAARELDDLDLRPNAVFIQCVRAYLGDADAKEAALDLANAGAALRIEYQRTAYWYLWLATSDVAHLKRSHDLFHHQLSRVPEAYHESMRSHLADNVALLEAWARHGAAGS